MFGAEKRKGGEHPQPENAKGLKKRRREKSVSHDRYCKTPSDERGSRAQRFGADGPNPSIHVVRPEVQHCSLFTG
jgi:hypothetical protein